MRFVVAMSLLLLTGCAAKKPARAKPPTIVKRIDARPGKVVRFEGVRDGRCVIAFIKLDAQAGYVIVCAQ